MKEFLEELIGMSDKKSLELKRVNRGILETLWNMDNDLKEIKKDLGLIKQDLEIPDDERDQLH